eukprot:363764-Chlamydomonas_euryale.AAC.15
MTVFKDTVSSVTRGIFAKCKGENADGQLSHLVECGRLACHMFPFQSARQIPPTSSHRRDDVDVVLVR